VKGYRVIEAAWEEQVFMAVITTVFLFSLGLTALAKLVPRLRPLDLYVQELVN
jgi:hypothetical protein